MPWSAAAPRVGLAFSPAAVAWVQADPTLVDYLEIPFEQLRHQPVLAALTQTLPLVLHCASLSMAGFVAPDDATVQAVAAQAAAIGTPWIGEHIAFVAAHGLPDETGPAPAPLTYTVCPQLSEETIERVAANVRTLRPQLPVPLLLENSPQYFAVPGSTMDMGCFIAAVAERCDAGLLLDLSHLLITARNIGADPQVELERLPLERVVEVHLSGLSRHGDLYWDDHSRPAPPLLFELLAQLRARVRPQALTFEYNWAPDFPASLLREHVAQAREVLAAGS